MSLRDKIKHNMAMVLAMGSIHVGRGKTNDFRGDVPTPRWPRSGRTCGRRFIQPVILYFPTKEARRD